MAVLVGFQIHIWPSGFQIPFKILFGNQAIFDHFQSVQVQYSDLCMSGFQIPMYLDSILLPKYPTKTSTLFRKIWCLDFCY